jgi:hypothetical protein
MVTAAMMGAILVLSVSVFIPLTVYVGNRGEFAASYYDFLLTILPYAAIIITGIALLGSLLGGAAYRRYLAIVAAFGLLVWLQGNILVWDYGVLDGGNIDWTERAWRGVLDLGIWCVVLCVAYLGYERFGRVLIPAAVTTFGIQCIAAAMILAIDGSTLQVRSQIELDGTASEAITRFSVQQNVVHIVMDGFQSDLFSEIIDDPANANLKKELQGFTLFRDNLGAFPFTQMSVPAFLSSRLYRNSMPVDDFMSEVFSGDTILNAAFDAGFEVDIAAPIALRNIYSRGKYSHAYSIAASNNVTEEHYIFNDAAKLIDLSLFRAVPHFAKTLVHRDHLWVFQSMMQSKVNWVVQYFADLFFLVRLTTEMTADRDAPVYKMIHVMLAHQPTVGNEKCKFDGVHETNRANVTMQARCGLIWVINVLRRMRSLGIYDQSLIVLMGDHGAWVPVDSLMNEQDNRTGISAMGVAMATPVLAIKPPGVSGDLQVSNAPTSVIDVPATISDLLGLETQFGGMPVFSIPSEAPRLRRHMNYQFGKNPYAKGYLFPILEYRVDGSPLDAGAWHLDAKHHPATATQGVSDAP